MSTEAWDALKASYRIGDLTMPCCSGIAIPKTSPNGHHFFAHHVGECTSAPETIWHLNAKVLVTDALRNLGIECQPERQGGISDKKWIADIFFTYAGREIVVELQHSYQTLAAYRKRQKRYEEYGLECYWLLYQPRFYPLAKSIVKWRIRHEFGGRFPEESIFACVSDLPALILETEPNPIVRGAGRSSAALHEWLRGVLCQRFQWKNGLWDLLEDPEHSVANRLLAESEPT
jgi:competence protein CoiA